jgi:NIMA (never in mitosis gene a)-related kinase
MSGLYKRVIKGVYPKIPIHYSQELSQLVKSLIIVQPQLRPNCDQILESQAIVTMGEKIFGSDFYDKCYTNVTQNEMLQTIRVPKNLLYLTDRLPKPTYDNSPRRRIN